MALLKTVLQTRPLLLTWSSRLPGRLRHIGVGSRGLYIQTVKRPRRIGVVEVPLAQSC